MSSLAYAPRRRRACAQVWVAAQDLRGRPARARSRGYGPRNGALAANATSGASSATTRTRTCTPPCQSARARQAEHVGLDLGALAEGEERHPGAEQQERGVRPDSRAPHLGLLARQAAQ